MKILVETEQFGDYLMGMWLQEKKEKKSWLILDSIKLRKTVRTGIRIKKENYINENTLITRETLNRRCSWKHRQNEDFDK